MANERKAIKEEDLDKVVGGAFIFDRGTETLTYYHDDGSVTTHKILDFDNAWYSSNNWHAKNYPEDKILGGLISRGYIQG